MAEEEGAFFCPKEMEIDRPSAASDPQPPLVEEESPSAVMAGVFGELAARDEVVESEPRVEGEAMETQSFAFDAEREE